MDLIFCTSTISGSLTGTSVDNEDNLRFAEARNVRPMTEVSAAVALPPARRARRTVFLGVNMITLWGTLDLALVRHLWRLWYQIPMALPVSGPRILGDPKGRRY